MPSIARYMTCQPWTIRRDANLSQAHDLMREHAIRHLPVLEGGKLVGIISQRDVFLFDRLKDVDADVTVEDAMTVDVYTVSSEDSLDTVVETMAEHKYGAVIVMNRRGMVEGIFTTVDAMQAVADVLRRATS